MKLPLLILKCRGENQTVQVVRTGTNTYFKDQKDGWIECIVGKI